MGHGSDNETDHDAEPGGNALSLERPRTRGDCADGPRPCPWVGCRHHLYLDVNPENGTIKINDSCRSPWDLEETCALDVADQGGVTLNVVGDLLNVTRERVRQIERKALVMIGRSTAACRSMGADGRAPPLVGRATRSV